MTTTCTICADPFYELRDFVSPFLKPALEAAISELPADAAAMIELNAPLLVVEWLVAYYLPDTEIGRHLRHGELMHYFTPDDCRCHTCRHQYDSLASDWYEALMRGTNPEG
jgi:hypothetical protein